MAGESQERFEDYLELERYIDELQKGRAARPPKDLWPNQVQIYRMAAMFRSASPDAAEPRPGFQDELYARLLALGAGEQDEDTLKRPVVGPAPQPTLASEPITQQQTGPDSQKLEQGAVSSEMQRPLIPELPAPSRRSVPGKGRVVSRRSMLAGGVISAASLAAGAGLGAAATRAITPPTSAPQTSYGGYLLPEVMPVDRQYITTMDALKGGKVQKFMVGAIVGYVLLNDSGDDKSTEDPVVAMSAACTHMGCIVDWDPSARTYKCPCHRGQFSEYGKPGAHSNLAPLPRLRTVLDGNKIYVEVPKGTGNGVTFL